MFIESNITYINLKIIIKKWNWHYLKKNIFLGAFQNRSGLIFKNTKFDGNNLMQSVNRV